MTLCHTLSIVEGLGKYTQKYIVTIILSRCGRSTKSDEQDMQDTVGEGRTNSWETFVYGPLHMDEPMLADQQESIYICFVQTQGVVRKTCREGWMIGADGEWKSGNPCHQRDLMMMMMMKLFIISKRLDPNKVKMATQRPPRSDSTFCKAPELQASHQSYFNGKFLPFNPSDFSEN